ncbi:MAG: exodeoxyribonuclease V subunit alpha [Spirochaeta sp. LUC14_002_19_P3]|nr:MAG: exodeoxyribonuclease V subunit alpha [Spirochaeta sp. LUC14_002_19_P3]
MIPAARQALSMGFSPFRVHLASSLYQYAESLNEELFWLLLHVAEQAGNGHLCTKLDTIAEDMAVYGDEIPLIKLLAYLNDLLSHGIKAGLIGRLEAEDAPADSLPFNSQGMRPPLVLGADGGHLYFLRRRREEDNFLAMLCARAHSGSPPPSSTDTANPAQALAAMYHSGRKIMLLTGGPGTGKTTAIAKLIQQLGPDCRIKLAAPTGRAASRLAENIPGLQGHTLHRLLGIVPGRGARHNPHNPLEADLVIVDEASMVDLPLMNTLLRGLAPRTALLLSGDPDQLPSVEAGALLGDILAGAQLAAEKGITGLLSGAVIQLGKVYRSNTAVLKAAAAVRSGSMEHFMAAIDGEALTLTPMSRPEQLAARLAAAYRRRPGSLDAFSALTPLRRGPWGVPAMNDHISRFMNKSTLPFPGMPIAVTHNDASRSLWNGDRAILRGENSRLRAAFPNREHPLAVLPGWEPAWIQTIHRGQGSEFDAVAVILPEGADRLLTREILYTAITRAKHKVEIFADETTLAATLNNKVVRNSRIRGVLARPACTSSL